MEKNTHQIGEQVNVRFAGNEFIGKIVKPTKWEAKTLASNKRIYGVEKCYIVEIVENISSMWQKADRIEVPEDFLLSSVEK